MSMISPSTTVGALVAQRPARSRIFEQLGIDYCCGGKRPLNEVCAEKGLDAATVVRMLEAAESTGSQGPDVDPASLTLTELADHIERTHHDYLRHELPRIQGLLARVINAHGERLPWVKELGRVFDGFIEEIHSHMMKEERILFPMVRAIESGNRHASHYGSMADPIRVMEMEHDAAGDALATMRSLTDGFAPEPDACNTFVALLDALAELERDMHQHIHKENNILFPRALEREREEVGGRAVAS